MNYLTQASIFLVDTLFGLFILLLMLRFLILWLRTEFSNPFAQVLFRLTNPILRYLRPYIPQWRGLELSSLVLMWVLQYISLLITHSLAGSSSSWFGLMMVSDVMLFSLLINILLVSLLFQVIASWIMPNQYNPILSLVHNLNQPLLSLAQRHLPQMQGIDFSPMAVMLGLYLISMLVVAPLIAIGLQL